MAQLLKLTPDSILLMGGLGVVGYYLYINGYPPFGTNEFRLPFLDDLFKGANGDDAEDRQSGIPQVQTGGNIDGQKPAITYNPLAPNNNQQLPQSMSQPQYYSDLENQFYRMLYLQQLGDTSQYPYNYAQEGPTTVGDPLLNNIDFPTTTPNTSSAIIVPSVNSIHKGGSFSIQCSGFAANEKIEFLAIIGNKIIATDNKTAGADGSAKLDTLTIDSTSTLGTAVVYAVGTTSGRIASASIQIVGSSNAVYIKSNYVPRDFVEVDFNKNMDDRLRYLKTLKYKKSSRSAILHASRKIAVN